MTVATTSAIGTATSSWAAHPDSAAPGTVSCACTEAGSAPFCAVCSGEEEREVLDVDPGLSGATGTSTFIVYAIYAVC